MWAATTTYRVLRNAWTNATRVGTWRRSMSTVDSGEIKHFERFTDEWWQEDGQFRPLHALNKLRVPLIRDGILATEGHNSIKPNPLSQINILDVGCGGGILTEPLARLGGNVTGLDANLAIIERAKSRAEKQHLKIEYCCASIEEFARGNEGKLDAVVASEILEHVTNKKEFLKACIECLKPGGSIFITTMNKTAVANILGIYAAEYVLRLVPTGTHQYEKFISPYDVQGMLQELDTRTVLMQGMFYNFLKNDWKWCGDSSINYALHGIKKGEIVDIDE